MFDVSRSEVRKSVEQAAWMPLELRTFALEKVKLKCLNLGHVGCLSHVL